MLKRGALYGPRRLLSGCGWRQFGHPRTGDGRGRRRAWLRQRRQCQPPGPGVREGAASRCGGGNQSATDAMPAVIRAWQGRGAPTMLTRMILDLTGQPDVGALYMAMYRGWVTRDTRRAATRLVFQAAALGDAVAIGILRRI